MQFPRTLLVAALILWTAFITVTLVIPQRSLARPSPKIQRRVNIVRERTFRTKFCLSSWIHIYYFGIQSLLVFLAAWSHRRKLKWALASSVVGVIAYSLLIEVVQELFVQGRGIQLSDVATNALGAVCGTVVGLAIWLAVSAARRLPKLITPNT